MPKICLVSWAPFYAGAEVAALRLSVGLRTAGHEVVCVVGTDGELLHRLRGESFKTYFVPTRFTSKWRWLPYRAARNQLARILHREQPDIVHSNDLPTHQMASDAARRVGIPRVCHHRWIFEGAAIDWFNKYGAERNVFVSQALMQELCHNSAILENSPCEVVHDGLPLPSTPTATDRATARRELDLPTDQMIVLFAGQVIERKGIVDIIFAWAKLKDRWAGKAQLVIVGDDLEGKGAYRQKAQMLATDLACPVRFVGFQQTVSNWLLAADIVLVPSHAEPLGNATLEAMAHARPVIGSHVGGIPEMVVPEQTGLLVPPKSPGELAAAIERLLSDGNLRACMGQGARQRCEEQFSLEAHVANMMRQYDLVLGSHHTATAGRLAVEPAGKY